MASFFFFFFSFFAFAFAVYAVRGVFTGMDGEWIRTCLGLTSVSSLHTSYGICDSKAELDFNAKSILERSW